LSRDSLKKFISISPQLKQLRNIKDITLDKLASELNIPFNTFLNYERNSGMPLIDKFINIARFFNISCDFLLLWKDSLYPHNLEFLKLAEKVDKLDFNERYKVEGSLSSLIGKDNLKEDINSKLDEITLPLGQDIAQNLSMLIEDKKVLKKDIASYLNISASQITHYENNKSVPSYESLVKLSEYFNTSIHSIITGEKLNFSFENKGLRESVFKADRFLDLRDTDFLVKLMKRIIEDSSPK
jgi:transcriptional regulator with XRE-family HTH domain